MYRESASGMPDTLYETPKECLEALLRECGYSIEYKCDAGVNRTRWTCGICHESWVTDSPYAAVVMPQGQAFTQEGALVLLIRKTWTIPHLDRIRAFKELGSLEPMESAMYYEG